MDDLLRIGQFAKLGRVSIKALRFYDAEGLLHPSFVDPHSGYRYYQVGQTRELATITNLRAGGFSISEILQLLNSEMGNEELLNQVSAKREKLLEHRASIDQQLQTVDTLLESLRGEHEQTLSAVKLTSIPEQNVHGLVEKIPSPDIDITAMFETAETTVAGFEARSDAPPFLIIHELPMAGVRARMEVCIPVREDVPIGLKTRLVEGNDLACSVVFSGSYSQTDTLRQRMQEWIAQVGLRIDGPLREVYYRFGADQGEYRLPASVLARSSDEYLTELLLPISTCPTEV